MYRYEKMFLSFVGQSGRLTFRSAGCRSFAESGADNKPRCLSCVFSALGVELSVLKVAPSGTEVLVFVF